MDDCLAVCVCAYPVSYQRISIYIKLGHSFAQVTTYRISAYIFAVKISTNKVKTNKVETFDEYPGQSICMMWDQPSTEIIRPRFRLKC